MMGEPNGQSQRVGLKVLGDYERAKGLAEMAEVPSAPASVKALRPLRVAQNRATLTDASAPGKALS